jgi:hypothetical protein
VIVAELDDPDVTLCSFLPSEPRCDSALVISVGTDLIRFGSWSVAASTVRTSGAIRIATVAAHAISAAAQRGMRRCISSTSGSSVSAMRSDSARITRTVVSLCSARKSR